MKYLQVKKHPILLLEVLIALALVALCALPLIYPHIFVLRSEKKFVATVELDHVVNLLYGQILQKLYQKEIAWQDLESGREIPIEPTVLEGLGYPDFSFTGSYRFLKIRQKPRKEAEKNAYLFRLEFLFHAKPGVFLQKRKQDLNLDSQDNLKYYYLIPIERVNS